MDDQEMTVAEVIEEKEGSILLGTPEPFSGWKKYVEKMFLEKYGSLLKPRYYCIAMNRSFYS